jgi:hypothetical protein
MKTRQAFLPLFNSDAVKAVAATGFVLLYLTSPYMPGGDGSGLWRSMYPTPVVAAEVWRETAWVPVLAGLIAGGVGSAFRDRPLSWMLPGARRTFATGGSVMLLACAIWSAFLQWGLRGNVMLGVGVGTFAFATAVRLFRGSSMWTARIAGLLLLPLLVRPEWFIGVLSSHGPISIIAGVTLVISGAAWYARGELSTTEHRNAVFSLADATRRESWFIRFLEHFAPDYVPERRVPQTMVQWFAHAHPSELASGNLLGSLLSAAWLVAMAYVVEDVKFLGVLLLIGTMGAPRMSLSKGFLYPMSRRMRAGLVTLSGLFDTLKRGVLAGLLAQLLFILRPTPSADRLWATIVLALIAAPLSFMVTAAYPPVTHVGAKARINPWSVLHYFVVAGIYVYALKWYRTHDVASALGAAGALSCALVAYVATATLCYLVTQQFFKRIDFV